METVVLSRAIPQHADSVEPASAPHAAQQVLQLSSDALLAETGRMRETAVRDQEASWLVAAYCNILQLDCSPVGHVASSKPPAEVLAEQPQQHPFSLQSQVPRQQPPLRLLSGVGRARMGVLQRQAQLVHELQKLGLPLVQEQRTLVTGRTWVPPSQCSPHAELPAAKPASGSAVALDDAAAPAASFIPAAADSKNPVQAYAKRKEAQLARRAAQSGCNGTATRGAAPVPATDTTQMPLSARTAGGAAAAEDCVAAHLKLMPPTRVQLVSGFSSCLMTSLPLAPAQDVQQHVASHVPANELTGGDKWRSEVKQMARQMYVEKQQCHTATTMPPTTPAAAAAAAAIAGTTAVASTQGLASASSTDCQAIHSSRPSGKRAVAAMVKLGERLVSAEQGTAGKSACQSQHASAGGLGQLAESSVIGASGKLELKPLPANTRSKHDTAMRTLVPAKATADQRSKQMAALPVHVYRSSKNRRSSKVSAGGAHDDTCSDVDSSSAATEAVPTAATAPAHSSAEPQGPATLLLHQSMSPTHMLRDATTSDSECASTRASSQPHDPQLPATAVHATVSTGANGSGLEPAVSSSSTTAAAATARCHAKHLRAGTDTNMQCLATHAAGLSDMWCSDKDHAALDRMGVSSDEEDTCSEGSQLGWEEEGSLCRMKDNTGVSQIQEVAQDRQGVGARCTVLKVQPGLHALPIKQVESSRRHLVRVPSADDVSTGSWGLGP